MPERYPDLHFALIEFNAHWLASLVGAMDKCWVTGIGQDADWWLGYWDDNRPANDQPSMAQLFRAEREVAVPAHAERVRAAPVPRVVPGRSRRDRVPAHHRRVDDRVGQRLPARRGHVPRQPGAASRKQFADVPADERAAMLGGTLARLLGFDAPVAA